MTLPRYEAICAHWQRVPPVAISASQIAQSLGAQQRPASRARAGADEAERVASRQGLFDMLGGAGFNQRAPEWLQATQSR